MNRLFLMVLIFITLNTFAVAKSNCKRPLKEERKFVITNAIEAPERGGWELMGSIGDTPDLINCKSNLYGTIDVVNGEPKEISFHFKSKAACKSALTKLKSASKNLPIEVVIDKDCTAHLANHI